ncbi:nucleotide triphosphate diphosphatase NUDT15 [Sporobolomyces koalae]|uniref:nucleotide triphosphate diphosphatase NUDT15 n=1 Tax=Sporobolomyces koalae TaxID=500713 RepID=UPI003181B033
MGTVRVGVGCFVLNEKNEFIVGLRKGSHGAGCIQLPGGHLELTETFQSCAIREVLEETGIELNPDRDQLEVVTATNDVFVEAKKHYVTVFVKARVQGRTVEPKILEPEKCESWNWTTWADIVRIAQSDDHAERERLFLPLRNLVEQYPEIDPTAPCIE